MACIAHRRGAVGEWIAGVAHAREHGIVGTEVVGEAVLSPLVGARQGRKDGTESLNVDVGDEHEAHVDGCKVERL